MAHFRTLALIISALVFCARADAQTFAIFATNSPTSVSVSNSLTYTISVTNATGLFAQNIFITNVFSSAVEFEGASTNFQSGQDYTNSVSITSSNVVFTFGSLNDNDFVQMTLTVQPLTVGPLTNFISVGGTVGGPTIPALFTNVVPVINTNVMADLGVTMNGFPSDIYVNDRVTYEIAVTNYGPDSAGNVILSNGVPAGVELLGISPTNHFSTTTNFIVLNLGTLTNGGSKNIFFTVEPTNSGLLNFSALVNAAGVIDSNAANNSVSSDIIVQDFFGTLIATNVSPMQFDPQTGLEYETVRLSNIGSNSVPAARVIVSGLTNQLYNAVGTNDGDPFVVYGDTLDTNQSVDLILEYFVKTRSLFTVSNSQYTAVGVNATNYTALAGTNGTFAITNMFHFSNGNFLIEFTSTPGNVYTIYYSDDLTSWLAAQPSITAQANKTQWIDDGPPKTISPPPSQRYYRVYLNP